jgi:hypothetical protein
VGPSRSPLALPMIRNSRSLRNACSLLCIVLIVLLLESLGRESASGTIKIAAWGDKLISGPRDTTNRV